MLKRKTALITGVTGQDGRLMAEYLLDTSYEVIGLSRHSKPPIQNPYYQHFQCDYKNPEQISQLILKHRPSEIYHFAANSFPGDNSSGEILIEDNVKSFSILASACLKHAPQSRFFNASSAYIFKPQTEKCTLQSEQSPQSPYGISKHLCHKEAISLRNQQGYFITNGILFNHESIYRDERFVTIKVIKAALDIKAKRRDILELGNINVVRDWSHAKDFIPAIHQCLQLETPSDYIFSSGKPTSLKDYIHLVFLKVGIELEWLEDKDQLIASEITTKKILVKSKRELFRSSDYTYLVGDNSKAREILGLKINYTIENIISELIDYYTHTA